MILIENSPESRQASFPGCQTLPQSLARLATKEHLCCPWGHIPITMSDTRNHSKAPIGFSRDESRRQLHFLVRHYLDKSILMSNSRFSLLIRELKACSCQIVSWRFRKQSSARSSGSMCPAPFSFVHFFSCISQRPFLGGKTYHPFPP